MHFKPFRDSRRNREQAKCQRLQKAAAHCLQRTHRDNDAPCRFDVIAIEGDRANARIDTGLRMRFKN